MTLQEIIAYVNGRYTSGLVDTEIIEHINEIYRDVTRAFTKDTTKETTIATVESQEIYQLTEASRRIKEIHITNETRSRLRSMRADARVYPRKSGTPLRWFPYGLDDEDGSVRQQYGLDPIPDAVLNVHVLYEPVPTVLSEDNDNILYIPEEYQYVIGYGTIALLASNQEDWNVSQAWEARYRSAINEMIITLGIIPPNNYPDLSKMRSSSE